MTDERIREIRALIARHKLNDHLFAWLGLICTMIAVLMLLAAFIDLVVDGASRFTWQFFTSFPSRRATEAGILSAWVGSALVMLVTMFAAVPLGVAAAIYLE